MKTTSHNGFSEENLVMFPAAKNFKIERKLFSTTSDPLDDLLSEFSHLKDEDTPFFDDERFEDDNDLDLDESFYSLDAFMNRHQIGNVQTPDDRLIALINERLDAISEAKERIKFYLEEIEMFMPRKKR
jgi:hypothetical protein